MTPRFLEACQSLQPAEKACWDILLRELPDASTIAHETLDTAMDQTLDQLWSLLREGPVETGLQSATEQPPPLPTDLECALTTHLPYFNAGERALELIAGEVMQTDPALKAPRHCRDREELCSAYNVLVQCQLEAICRKCGLAGQCRYGDLRAVARLPSAGSEPPFEKPQTPSRSTRRSPARRTHARHSSTHAGAD